MDFRRFFIGVSVSLIVFVGCATQIPQSNVKKSGIIVLDRINETPFTGYAIYNDSLGYTQKGMMVNGMFNGSNSVYFDGALFMIGQMVYNKKHGVWYYFFSNGDLMETVNYNLGVKQGIRLIYSPNGRLLLKGYYTNDTLEGKVSVYNEDGGVRFQVKAESLDSLYQSFQNK